LTNNVKSLMLRDIYKSAAGSDLKIQVCGMTNGAVGLTVSWQQPYPNVLDGSSLLIRQYMGGLILPDEGAGQIDLDPTRLVGEAKYLPDLSLAREYGWRQENMIDFVSSAALGEQCVIQLMNLANRYATGELREVNDYVFRLLPASLCPLDLLVTQIHFCAHFLSPRAAPNWVHYPVSADNGALFHPL
jgi:hypothetical protein